MKDKMDINDFRDSVWCGTGNLKLGRYLSNADGVGWDFCLARQHGLATYLRKNTRWFKYDWD